MTIAGPLVQGMQTATEAIEDAVEFVQLLHHQHQNNRFRSPMSSTASASASSSSSAALPPPQSPFTISIAAEQVVNVVRMVVTTKKVADFYKREIEKNIPHSAMTSRDSQDTTTSPSSKDTTATTTTTAMVTPTTGNSSLRSRDLDGLHDLMNVGVAPTTRIKRSSVAGSSGGAAVTFSDGESWRLRDLGVVRVCLIHVNSAIATATTGSAANHGGSSCGATTVYNSSADRSF